MSSGSLDGEKVQDGKRKARVQKSRSVDPFGDLVLLAEFVESISENEKIMQNKVSIISGLVSSNLKGLLKGIAGFDFKD